MIHAVLDTNVLAAGYAHVTPRSAAVETYGRWLADEFTLVTSEHILDELGRTLRKSYFRARIPQDSIGDYLLLLRERSAFTAITEQVTRIAAHSEDDLVLATALSGGAAYVVTGDRAFLRVREYRGVQIVTPRQFLDVLDQPGEPRR